MEERGDVNACAFTGHRPSRFSFQHDESDPLCLKIKGSLSAICVCLYHQCNVRVFFSGCALGVDQWGAEAVLKLKTAGYPDVKLICAAPFPDFVAKWNDQQKQRIRQIWDQADTKVFLSKSYSPSVYYERNQYMVDNAEYLVAVFDQSKNTRSGTFQTISAARAEGRIIIYVHPDTASFDMREVYVRSSSLRE